MFSADLKFDYPGSLQLTGSYTINNEAEKDALEKFIAHANDPLADHEMKFSLTHDEKGTMAIVINIQTEEHLDHIAALKASASKLAESTVEAGHEILELTKEAVGTVGEEIDHLVHPSATAEASADLAKEQGEEKAATELLNQGGPAPQPQLVPTPSTYEAARAGDVPATDNAKPTIADLEKAIDEGKQVDLAPDGKATIQ